MRALTRMRTLAAACALLLFVSGMVAAGPLDRQIDRPGTGEQRPPMVGDPDSGQSMPVPLVLGGRVFLWRITLWGPRAKSGQASRTPAVSIRRAHR